MEISINIHTIATCMIIFFLHVYLEVYKLTRLKLGGLRHVSCFCVRHVCYRIWYDLSVDNLSIALYTKIIDCYHIK